MLYFSILWISQVTKGQYLDSYVEPFDVKVLSAKTWFIGFSSELLVFFNVNVI